MTLRKLYLEKSLLAYFLALSEEETLGTHRWVLEQDEHYMSIRVTSLLF